MTPTLIERRAPLQLPPEPAAGDAFGLRSAVEAVLRRGPLVAAVFCTVMGAAALLAWLTPPVYRADTLLRIDPPRRDSLVLAAPPADRLPQEPSRGMVAAEQSLLSSRELLLPVITSTGADIDWDSVRYAGGLPAGGRHGISVPLLELPASWVGQPLSLRVADGRWRLADREQRPLAEGQVGMAQSFLLDGAPARLLVQAPAGGPGVHLRLRKLEPLKAIDDVGKRLRVLELSRDSGVLRLTFEDERPERAAALLNTLVQRYLEETVRRKADEADRALGFVDTQLPAMKERLEAAERALADHLQKSRVMVPSAETEALLRQRGELERQQVDLQVKREQLSQSLTPEHPELAALIKQLATVRTAIDRLDGSTSRLPEQGRELARLQRVVQSETQLYTAMLQQAQQLRLATGSWLAGAVQMDKAVPPAEAVRPKLSTLFSLGAGAGLVLSIAAALLARALQPTVDPVRGLRGRGVPPTLAVIPQSSAQLRLMANALDDKQVDDESLGELGMHRLLARTAPDDPAVDSLRSVFLGLMARERSGPNKVVVLTAPSSGTGKAFVAANLAAVMAEAGRKVLLIDADRHHPAVHRLVGLDPRAEGLSDLLTRRRADAHAAIHRHASAGFDVMLHGTRHRHRGTPLLSPAMEPLMQALRHRYDHVVINAAPVLRGQDAVILGRLADVAYMVLRPESSGEHESRQALQRLAHGGVPVEGLVLNGVRRSRLNAPLLA